MEPRKRKAPNLELTNFKRIRTFSEDTEIFSNKLIQDIIRLKNKNKKLEKEKIQNLQKNETLICENFELVKKLNLIEKKIVRIEKFNEELRNKNTKLEKEIELFKENEICNTFNSISLLQPFSYIN